MSVWEYIRLRPVVGCLPFWGELFLAQYHVPDGGMCLLRKDKLLSFTFGKLLLACQRGLYLVLVLFSQQAGKIVMMMRLEIYWGCFPRAEEDTAEVGFEFPALNLVPVFSTSCSQAQACSAAARTRAYSLWFGIGEIPPKLALWMYSLVPSNSLSLFCWALAAAASFPAPLVTRAVLATHTLPDALRAEIQRAAAIVPIKTLFACNLQWAPGLNTIQKSPEMEGNMSPDTHCGNLTSPVLSPCEKVTAGTSQRCGVIPWVYLISYLSCVHLEFATGTSTVQQEHPRFLFPEGRAYGHRGLCYLHFQLEIYSVLVRVWKKSPLEEVKRQISQCKHDFIAFV